jgi:DNA-binding MarR family transcriptional regulator/GNAT superfamily N-acetyltransferase
MQVEDIQQVRRFNRLVTQRIGALGDSYLSRGRPLGEARLIFEVGSGVSDLRVLRQRLGLDSGYLSRLVRSLENQGLVEVRRSAGDGRAREVRLTEKGCAEFAAYDALSDGFARDLLTPLGPVQRQRLVAAMREVELLLRSQAVEIAVEAANGTAARWCLDRYFAELAERFDEGFDPGQGGGLSVADMTPPAGYLLIAWLDGEPVGCGALKRLDGHCGEVKRLWVDPAVRGLGVAGRLMDRLEALAAEIGCSTVVLDTNKALVEAKAMYLRRGYREIDAYNDNPYAHHWFEKRV